MSPNFYITFLEYLGFVCLLNFLFNTCWGLFQLIYSIVTSYVNSNEENTTLAKRFGSWALITGSTDGIGKAYAFELAKRGINIVLVSRNKEKLEDTAAEIKSKYSVKTKIIAADFSRGVEAIEVIKQAIGSIEIGILVNNVGKMNEYPAYLDEIPEKELWDIININIGAVTMMCRAFIPSMKKRGKGAIVNVSSGSELQPLPLLTVYAATKAYIRSFTASLRYECANDGLTIQHLGPYFLNTKMNAYSSILQKTTYIVPDAEMFAKYAVFTLGKQDISTGYWCHEIQSFIIQIVPEWLRMRAGARMTKYLRREYLKKEGIKRGQ